MERICEKKHLQAGMREARERIWSSKIMELATREAPQTQSLRKQLETFFSNEGGMLNFDNVLLSLVYSFPATSLQVV